MATTTDNNSNSDDPPRMYRIQSKVELAATTGTSSPAAIRALLTPMGIKELSPGVYRVFEKNNRYKTNLNTQACTCNAGTKQETYQCRHQHHIQYRRQTGTAIDPPDREDPVKKQARENKPIAEASRAYEEQIERGGGVVAGPDELLLQCVGCEEYTVMEDIETVDAEPYVCGECPPIDDSIVYLNTPRDMDENMLVVVRDVVADQCARSYYPGDESVFSLGDMFDSVEGVRPDDSVVIVSKHVSVDAVDGFVFETGTRAVPQGALRAVVKRDV